MGVMQSYTQPYPPLGSISITAAALCTNATSPSSAARSVAVQVDPFASAKQTLKPGNSHHRFKG
jgi:hypothetical protein